MEEIKLAGLRRRIAENMAESKRRIPHFAYVEEVDVTAVEALRQAMERGQGGAPQAHHAAFSDPCHLQGRRWISRWSTPRFDDEAGVIARHSAVHLGMATQTDAGLSVPVIRDAQARDVWMLAAENRPPRRRRAARQGGARGTGRDRPSRSPRSARSAASSRRR